MKKAAAMCVLLLLLITTTMHVDGLAPGLKGALNRRRMFDENREFEDPSIKEEKQQQYRRSICSFARELDCDKEF